MILGGFLLHQINKAVYRRVVCFDLYLEFLCSYARNFYLIAESGGDFCESGSRSFK